MSEILIKNCKLYNKLNNGLFDILIDGKSITKIQKKIETDNSVTVIDAKSKIAIPGFIDVHIQGAGGADILDIQSKRFRKCLKHLPPLALPASWEPPL